MSFSKFKMTVPKSVLHYEKPNPTPALHALPYVATFQELRFEF